MIGIFADPYRGELDYSVFSRTFDQAGLSSQQATNELYFGSANVRAVIGFQSQSSYLLQQLHPYSEHEIETFIEHHSMLRMYKPFLPEDRYSSIAKGLQQGRNQQVEAMLGRISSGITTHTTLRYCPVCFYEDEELHGEAYWHRIHQVEGVYVCPKHDVFTKNSSIHKSELREFIPLSRVGINTQTKFVDHNISEHRNLSYLSKKIFSTSKYLDKFASVYGSTTKISISSL